MLTTPASPTPAHVSGVVAAGADAAQATPERRRRFPPHVRRPAIFRRSAWKAFLLFFPAWFYVGVLVLAGAVVADLLILGLSALVPPVSWPYGDVTSAWLALARQLSERGLPC